MKNSNMLHIGIEINLDKLEEDNSKIPSKEPILAIIPKPFTNIHYYINKNDK